MHNHHNFAWWEKHAAEALGASQGRDAGVSRSAGLRRRHDGGRAVIRGRRRTDRAESALYSTVHGAGRVLAGRRRRASSIAGRASRLSRGVVNWPKWQQQLKAQGIELRGGGAGRSAGMLQAVCTKCSPLTTGRSSAAHAAADRRGDGRKRYFDPYGTKVQLLLSLGLSGAGVAQLVEQLIRNQQVIGSSPIAGSSFPQQIETSRARPTRAGCGTGSAAASAVRPATDS